MTLTDIRDIRAILNESDDNDSLHRAIGLPCDLVQEQGMEIKKLKAEQAKTDRAINEANPDFKGY